LSICFPVQRTGTFASQLKRDNTPFRATFGGKQILYDLDQLERATRGHTNLKAAYFQFPFPSPPIQARACCLSWPPPRCPGRHVADPSAAAPRAWLLIVSSSKAYSASAIQSSHGDLQFGAAGGGKKTGSQPTVPRGRSTGRASMARAPASLRQGESPWTAGDASAAS
jgi:hypothetical protein